MDEEGEGAVLGFDLGRGDPWLEVEDGVGVEAEGGEDAGDFGVFAEGEGFGVEGGEGVFGGGGFRGWGGGWARGHGFFFER